MNAADYEQTLLAIKKLSFDELFAMMFETRDDLLAYKIRTLLDHLGKEHALQEAAVAQDALLSYIQHAYQVTSEPTNQTIGEFFSF